MVSAWVQMDRAELDSQESITSQDAKSFKQRDEAVVGKSYLFDMPDMNMTDHTAYIPADYAGIILWPIELHADANRFVFAFDYLKQAGGVEINVQVSIIGSATTVSGTFISTAISTSWQAATITLTLNADHIGATADLKVEFKQNTGPNSKRVHIRSQGASSHTEYV